MKNLLTRRSIRKYSDQAVSDELLNRLMNEAARTQTMGNLQLYSVVVTRSAEMKAPSVPTSTVPARGPDAGRLSLVTTTSCRL